MGPFCVTPSNPTHQLTDPTQSNRLPVEKFGPNPTQPNTTKHKLQLTVIGQHYHFITPSDRFPVPDRSAVKSNLTAWGNKILSNPAINAITQYFQILSTFATFDPTQPNPWVNRTHGQLWATNKMFSDIALMPRIAGP